jgi:hypothetical protein
MQLYNKGLVAKDGTKWHRDNQHSFSMYEATLHNTDIHLDRVDNKGVLVPRYDMADELEATAVEIAAKITDEDIDDVEAPSALNFLPTDVLNEIQQQKPLERDRIAVAFPLNYEWQNRQEMVTAPSNESFLAKPPQPRLFPLTN